MTQSNADILRQIYPNVLAKTLACTRALPDAEDAVQEAVLRALATWPKRGVPDSPEAWLLTVATNVHRDRIRKGRFERPPQDALETLAQMSPWLRIAVGTPTVSQGWKDELLRLVFACCHPELEPGESAALCLSTVVGLSTNEIALAFVTQTRSMEQRLARARKRLRQRGDVEGLPPAQSSDRLDAVLRVLHLLFNEGYWSSDSETPIRSDLCRLAIGLAYSLVDVFPREPEALALLALFLFHDARRDARLDPHGHPVALPDQDRTRWDQHAIRTATQFLQAALDLRRSGPTQLEAAISATHCDAHCAAATDWSTIAALYERLEQLRPTPAVRVNRAFAVARTGDPHAGLALLDDRSAIDADSYPYAHLVRGTLLAELGCTNEARASLEQARQIARNRTEAAQISDQIERLSEPSPDQGPIA